MKGMGVTVRQAPEEGACPPGQRWGGVMVPMLLPDACHQKVASCRELEAVDKTHLEGTRQK